MTLDPHIRRLLDEAEIEWALVQRRRHIQLVIGDRAVLTIPRGHRPEGRRATRNAIGAVRRYLRTITGEQP